MRKRILDKNDELQVSAGDKPGDSLKRLKSNPKKMHVQLLELLKSNQYDVNRWIGLLEQSDPEFNVSPQTKDAHEDGSILEVYDFSTMKW